MSISDKIKFVRDRISDAAIRSGRGVGDIKLVAVTKYVAAGDRHIDAFIRNGCVDFGESRVQSLLDKIEYFDRELPESLSINVTNNVTKNQLRWHMIGTLQRNKIRKILPYISLIHSIDSERLAGAVDRVVVEAGLGDPVECLLEVAISGEETKQGFNPSEIYDVVGRFGQFRNLRMVGLMCMSGLLSGELQTRREFEAVRKIAEKLKSQKLPENCTIKELSMGMSDDFETAIEEGATIVRIGRLLYE
ncbi:MAG: YggS family pyridoxal phosphate-dependent enzyme [Planctomycetaceae bacterium]|jgi:pyridoxal phosphate enzyme (YggS family)|nr:YggS family pyridoxal phosphate-dependent enzyme [Planctomycetaceae bacterium]